MRLGETTSLSEHYIRFTNRPVCVCVSIIKEKTKVINDPYDALTQTISAELGINQLFKLYNIWENICNVIFAQIRDNCFSAAAGPTGSQSIHSADDLTSSSSHPTDNMEKPVLYWSQLSLTASNQIIPNHHSHLKMPWEMPFDLLIEKYFSLAVQPKRWWLTCLY